MPRIVTLNEKTREMAFLEVKWSDPGLKGARRLLDGLEEKVRIRRLRKKEHFGIIAKKIKDKEIRKEGYLCYDLRDMKF